MSKKSIKHNLDSDSLAEKTMGRPTGTKRAPKAALYQNVPFTEIEDKKLQELIEIRGGDKRSWIKKFFWEGLTKELAESK